MGYTPLSPVFSLLVSHVISHAHIPRFLIEYTLRQANGPSRIIQVLSLRVRWTRRHRHGEHKKNYLPCKSSLFRVPLLRLLLVLCWYCPHFLRIITKLFHDISLVLSLLGLIPLRVSPPKERGLPPSGLSTSRAPHFDVILGRNISPPHDGLSILPPHRVILKSLLIKKSSTSCCTL